MLHGASAVPDILYGVVVPAGLHTEHVTPIEWQLAHTADIRHNDNFAIGDANELTGIRRLRVGSGLQVDLAGQFLIAFAARFRVRHGYSSRPLFIIASVGAA